MVVPLPGTGNAGAAAGWWGGADFGSPLGDFKALVRHPSGGTQNAVGGPARPGTIRASWARGWWRKPMRRLGNGCPLGEVSAVQSQAFRADRVNRPELRGHAPCPGPRPLQSAPPPNHCHGLPGSQAPSWGPQAKPPPSSLHSLAARSQPTRQLGINCTLFHKAAYQIHSLYPLIKKAIKFVCSNLCCTNSRRFLIRLWGVPWGVPGLSFSLGGCRVVGERVTPRGCWIQPCVCV